MVNKTKNDLKQTINDIPRVILKNKSPQSTWSQFELKKIIFLSSIFFILILIIIIKNHQYNNLLNKNLNHLIIEAETINNSEFKKIKEQTKQLKQVFNKNFNNTTETTNKQNLKIKIEQTLKELLSPIKSTNK